MIVKSRIKEKGINALMIVLLLLGTGIYSCSVQAQSFAPFKYMGFEGTFGVRSFGINSDIPQIDQMSTLVEGGSVGFTFGSDFLRAKLRAGGFYYSAASVPRTVDLFESETLLNFYPLQYFRKSENSFDIYLLAGVSMDNVKFYGHYMSDEKVNYSTSSEPFLGRITQFNTAIGLGFEYQLPLQGDFLHFFAEAKYGVPVSSDANRVAFENTSIERFTSVNVGVSFGMKQ
jgi:hypothetical protein